MKKKAILLILIIFIPIFAMTSNSDKIMTTSSYQRPSSSATQDEPTFISCSLVENHSISWLNSYLVFNITSDSNITIGYLVTGFGLHSERIMPISVLELNLTSGSHEITIPVKPTFGAIPGAYNYSLEISFVNSSSGVPVSQRIYSINPGEIIVTMGDTWLIVVSAILLFGSLIIIIRKEKLREEKPGVSGTTQTYVSDTKISEVSQDTESSKPGFIKCPECKKDIKEGSSFCPECGYHIPKFLRTGQ